MTSIEVRTSDKVIPTMSAQVVDSLREDGLLKPVAPETLIQQRVITVSIPTNDDAPLGVLFQVDIEEIESAFELKSSLFPRIKEKLKPTGNKVYVTEDILTNLDVTEEEVAIDILHPIFTAEPVAEIAEQIHQYTDLTPTLFPLDIKEEIHGFNPYVLGAVELNPFGDLTSGVIKSVDMVPKSAIIEAKEANKTGLSLDKEPEVIAQAVDEQGNITSQLFAREDTGVMMNDPMQKQGEAVDRPNHYIQGKVEVIDIIEQITADYPPAESFGIGSVIKYVARAPHKNDLEDLEKALWYLTRIVEKRREAQD